MDYLTNWIIENWIEISGAAISLIYLYFSYKQNLLLWPFGLLSALFYIWIYYDSGFYADMSLQVYYVGISVYGWYNWTGGRGAPSNKKSLKPSHVQRMESIILFIISLILWVIIYLVLLHLTNSVIPIMDSFTTAMSIVATWMLARKILEHWLVWIIVDSVSIGLYLYKELYATAFLFLIYTLVAIGGYYAWKNDMEKQR